MKRINLVYLLVLMFFISFASCEKISFPNESEQDIAFKAEDDEYEVLRSVNNLLEINDENCVKVFHHGNSHLIPVKIIDIGIYHNELISELQTVIVINDMCNPAEYRIIQTLMDEAILSNEKYIEVFGSTYETSIETMYFEVFDVCQQTPEESYNKVLNVANFDSLEIFSQFELNLLDSFFTETINSPTTVNIANYVYQVLDNKHEFFLDGHFFLTVLSIFEHSSCFWLTYRSDFSFRAAVVPALMDVAGGAYGMMKNIWRNRKHFRHGCGPCADRDILDEAAHNAASASIPVVGGDLYKWATGRN